MLDIERKITNFTNHSMHGYTSAICQFLFIFRCHSRLSWGTKLWSVNTYLLFQRYRGMVKWWEWFNSCLGYLRQCSHRQSHTMSTHSWTLLHLAFYSEISRRSCARVSRTCCFRLPEQMDIRSAFCLPSQTNDLPSPFPAFLPPWYILPSPSLLPLTCCTASET